MKTKYILLMIAAATAIRCNKNDAVTAIELPELQNEPPLSFNLIDVADKATDVDVLPTLSWESAKNPEGNEVAYDLYLGKEKNPSTLYKSGISETSFQIEERLHLISDYYWKVVAKDVDGQTSQSPVHRLTTRNLMIPNAPIDAHTDFNQRGNHSTVVFDDKLWLVGGYNIQGTTNDAWFTRDDFNWSMFAENSRFCDRSGHTTVVYQNKIYVMGGFLDEAPFEFEVWQNVNGIDWENITAKNIFSERGNHTSLVFDDKIWVIGGTGFKNFKFNEVWSSTDGGTWSKMELDTPSFSPRSGHASVVFDDKMWVIGGWDDTGLKNDVWSTIDGIHWVMETTNADFSKRRDHTVTVLDGKMWLLGGASSTYTNYGIKNDIWYSDDGTHWTALSVPQSFPARSSHTAVSHQDKIWVIGGLINVDDPKHANDFWVLE